MQFCCQGRALGWIDPMIVCRGQSDACKPCKNITAMKWAAYYLHLQSNWPDDFRFRCAIWHHARDVAIVLPTHSMLMQDFAS